MKNLLILLLVAILTASSCRKPGDTAPDADKITLADINAIAGDYTFEGYAVSKTPGSSKVTLTIKKNSNTEWNFTGQSYVNDFGGTYNFDENAGSILFKQLVTTEMASFDNSQNLAEQEYYGNFKKVRKFKLEGSTLKLFDSEPASEIMIFKKK